MKRFSGILLFFFVFSTVLPQAVKEEIARIPNLVSHFKKHRETNPDVTFLEFYSLHYGKNYKQHQSDHNHSQLPGKQDHEPCCAFAVASPILSVHVPEIVLIAPVFSYSASAFVDPACFAFDPLRRIWQPPQAA
ncbi:MAG: hypothetical protein R2792_17135 [Saprospiraceae bacterium]